MKIKKFNESLKESYFGIKKGDIVYLAEGKSKLKLDQPYIVLKVFSAKIYDRIWKNEEKPEVDSLVIF